VPLLQNDVLACFWHAFSPLFHRILLHLCILVEQQFLVFIFVET
jgi:hypothetical protein